MATYETTDLSLAAAIKSELRLPFPEIRLDGRLSTFVFSVESQLAQQVATRFYNDDLQISARRYAQDLRDLKALIFRAKESQGR